MVDQRLAERFAAIGIIGRDLVRADARAEPAHTVRQPGRGEAYLRVAKAFAGLAQHLVGGDAQIVDQMLRSEEHTSELQSLMRISYAVFCLKKKKQTNTHYSHITDTHQKSATKQRYQPRIDNH